MADASKPNYFESSQVNAHEILVEPVKQFKPCPLASRAIQNITFTIKVTINGPCDTSDIQRQLLAWGYREKYKNRRSCHVPIHYPLVRLS